MLTMMDPAFTTSPLLITTPALTIMDPEYITTQRSP